MKILLIRRDNIGDLVCTTPLFAGLRERYPKAWIAALANSYNAPVLAGNPDLDAVYAYDKAKHRAGEQSLLGIYAQRLRMLRALRREGIDWAILAAPGWQPRSLRLARLSGARHIIGFVPAELASTRAGRRVDHALPYAEQPCQHETQRVWGLLAPLGVLGEPGAAKVVARNPSRSEAADALLVGVHISARKPSQRWPVERFAALIRAVHGRYRARFRLFWAPGGQSNATHPGDDEKATALFEAVRDLPVRKHPTPELAQLIDGLAACDVLVCGDGGAMHIGAGLGKPIVCFFGKSDPQRWRPWAVPYVLLQHPGLDVASITVEEALLAFRDLCSQPTAHIPEPIA